ncbi:MAG: hypothetical protein N2C14_31615 [Planctomycetales bacterium]
MSFPPRAALFGVILTVFAASGSQNVSAAEKEYRLQARIPQGQLTRVRMQLEVEGQLKLLDADKKRDLPLKVNAQFDYHERFVQGTPSQLGGLRSVRYYQRPRAEIEIGKGESQSELRSDRRLIVVDSPGGSPVQLFSPSGPLTREELDLLSTQANSLLLHALLPDKAVKVGDEWKATPDVWGAVLGVDAVAASDVKSKLSEVKDGVAVIDSHGHVDAAVAGVATEVEVKSRCFFHLSSHRVTDFSMAAREKRSVGHVSPGLEVVAKVRVKISPLRSSSYLGDHKLKGVPLAPNGAVTQLVYRRPALIQFHHGRDWFVVDEGEQGLSMRLIDSGELLAQCTVAAVLPGKSVAPPTPESFQAEIREAIGEGFQEFTEAAWITNEPARKVLRVVAIGEASGLPIQWTYYLIRDKNGRQAVFTFATETALVEQLKQADYQMVASLTFLAPSTAAAPPAPIEETHRLQAEQAQDGSEEQVTPIADFHSSPMSKASPKRSRSAEAPFSVNGLSYMQR